MWWVINKTVFTHGSEEWLESVVSKNLRTNHRNDNQLKQDVATFKIYLEIGSTTLCFARFVIFSYYKEVYIRT